MSATARLGFAYTRSLGGVSYGDMRKILEVPGMFDISTPFPSFSLYAEDPAMVEDERLRKLNTPGDEAVLLAKARHCPGPYADRGSRIPPVGAPTLQ